MQHVISRTIFSKRNFSFIKSSALLALLFSFLLCITFGLMFIGFQIEVQEVIMLFLKTLLVTWLLIVGCKLLFTMTLLMIKWMGSLQNLQGRLKGKLSQPFAGLLFCIVIYSCNGQPLVGVSKDLNTGMVTTYSKVKPEETVLVMNEEKLGHTQIPLGEKFIVVNSNVKGLIVKDNKISIGCSLVISDIDGKELLHEDDLFKGDSGIYDEKDAEYLKCTVSTGKPMEYDKKYNVAVKFWDKYGTGSIENKFAIEIIDLP